MSLSTSGSESSRYWLRLLLPALLTLVVLATCEVALRFIGLRVRMPWGKNNQEYNAVYTKAVNLQLNGKKLCVFIGDSRVEWAISAEIIQENLENNDVHNVEVFNLADPGKNVRSIMEKFQRVGFYPDYLVIGYSHLAFYWSKLNMEFDPKIITFKKRLETRLNSWWRDNFIISGYSLAEIWEFITTGKEPFNSWLSDRVITPRGQALIKYALPREEAIAYQKQYYQKMYHVPMPAIQMNQINGDFIKMVADFRKHGTMIILIRLPVGEWALKLERENDPYSVKQLAKDIGAPLLDLNDMQGALKLKTYDDIHVAPSSHQVLNRWVAQYLLLPILK